MVPSPNKHPAPGRGSSLHLCSHPLRGGCGAAHWLIEVARAADPAACCMVPAVSPGCAFASGCIYGMCKDLSPYIHLLYI